MEPTDTSPRQVVLALLSALPRFSRLTVLRRFRDAERVRLTREPLLAVALQEFMCHFLSFPVPVTTRYCFCDAEVAAEVVAAIPSDCRASGGWLLDACSTHEQFLNTLPSMNPYTSQQLLTCMSLRAVLSVRDPVDLLTAFPALPTHSLLQLVKHVTEEPEEVPPH